LSGAVSARVGTARLAVKLSAAVRHELKTAAKAAARQAYAPYSNFPVGAAVLTAEGAIYAGCNVENASFGLSICAERNAVFRAVAEGARAIRAIAIYTPTSAPTTPCGACRQVIAEFGGDVRVLCCIDDDASDAEYSLAELLPNAFGAGSL
jgi:cytidine deaminase